MKHLKRLGKFSVKFRRGDFGSYVDMADYIKEGYTAVILCKNNGTGLDPLRLLLPHQVYEKDLEAIFALYPDTTDFTIVPVNHEDYIEIWSLGK